MILCCIINKNEVKIVLKAENLTLNVDDEGGKKCLLNNISFQVEDGEMLVITGPNGGGKSTLAKTLIGIQTPDSGKIILDGQDITELDIKHRANAGIGFAYQQPPRFKGMTVMKLLKHGFQLRGHRQSKMRGVFQQRHAFIRDIEKDNCRPQNACGSDDLCIEDMPDADHNKN